MGNEIIELYKNAGYTFEQALTDLAMVLGSAMITDGKPSIEYLNGESIIVVSVKAKQLN